MLHHSAVLRQPLQKLPPALCSRANCLLSLSSFCETCVITIFKFYLFISKTGSQRGEEGTSAPLQRTCPAARVGVKLNPGAEDSVWSARSGLSCHLLFSKSVLAGRWNQEERAQTHVL